MSKGNEKDLCGLCKMPKMKAYEVSDRNCDVGCAFIVFAETRGKAISSVDDDDVFGDYSFIEMRAIRKPSLDKYYNGRKQMDWYDMDDRVAMVRDGNFRCSDEYDVPLEECEACPAHEWCEQYEGMKDS